ncbi:MAG: 3-methyladenine DNA glycosylase [Actinomycetaceae bacterium]|nr:3-methyladenine DNA glycosylase [Actinomycetaceae bacterium]
MDVLPAAIWWPRARAHMDAAHERSAGHQARRAAGQRHPVEDFLWEYYSLRPRRLAIWHPGVDRNAVPYGLAFPLDDEVSDIDAARIYWQRQSELPWYRIIEGVDAAAALVQLDPDYLFHRSNGIRHLTLLQRVLIEREPSFGCLGWHEWAMVYKVDETRHPLPLRLGTERTNELVEQAHIRCTHFDAFRFFSPAAVDLNLVQPAYDTVLEYEQAGCIHVTMDLLRACIQLAPLIPGELLIECFDLAMKARRIDMQASPYDCSSLGLEPIAIETSEGKARYIAAQRELAAQADPLRHRLLTILEPCYAAIQKPD